MAKNAFRFTIDPGASPHGSCAAATRPSADPSTPWRSSYFKKRSTTHNKPKILPENPLKVSPLPQVSVT